MNIDRLPIKLAKEPLLDVVFECRFLSDSESSVTHILPSLFITKSKYKLAKILKLSNSDIPEEVRNKDLNLRYLPLVKVELENYDYFIGDNSYSISCKLPYKGWKHFKEEILSSLEALEESGVTKYVESYHMKYVDFLKAESIEEQFKLVDVSVKIKQVELYNEAYNLAIRRDKPSCTNIIKVILGAEAIIDGNEHHVRGIAIDIDTIKKVECNLENMKSEIDESLELMHKEGKKEFFNLLKSETLSNLEPLYE